MQHSIYYVKVQYQNIVSHDDKIQYRVILSLESISLKVLHNRLSFPNNERVFLLSTCRLDYS